MELIILSTAGATDHNQSPKFTSNSQRKTDLDKND